MIHIIVKKFGQIDIELNWDEAPNTCANFVELVNKGFYNGLKFHRIIKGFMIQGGDPLGNGTGGPGYSIKGEFSSNGFDNHVKHTRGAISMARSSLPNSAGSQFFICDADDDFLDGDYAAFGHVVSGLDVLDAIASVRTNRYTDQPLTPVIIDKIIAEDEKVVPVEKIQ